MIGCIDLLFTPLGSHLFFFRLCFPPFFRFPSPVYTSHSPRAISREFGRGHVVSAEREPIMEPGFGAGQSPQRSPGAEGDSGAKLNAFLLMIITTWEVGKFVLKSVFFTQQKVLSDVWGHDPHWAPLNPPVPWSSPIQLRGLGERCELSKRSGQSSADKRFVLHSS